ncbi:MAG TPA: phosphatase PAP2 family protein [Pyrinomonadaceae bacterium]|nr:phosphatase PAP2 family protein [Pyrinomonadaceae bacterium]
MRFTRSSIYSLRISVFTILVLTAVSARAQTPSPTPSPTPRASATPSLENQFFKNILRDQKAIWTAPFHLHSQDARWLAPLGLGTAALIATDRRTGDEIAESRAQLNASRIVSYPGSAYGVGGVAATFYLLGRAKHDDRARETGILGAEALIDSAITVTVVKEIAQRTRPSGGVNRSDFFHGGSSFPSGHSIEAWSLATIIANEYHDKLLVQISAYGIASAVSVARFTGRKHYLSDVLVGSAMGYGIGKYVYHAHHRKTSNSSGDQEESRSSKRWPMIAPQYDRHAREYGVALAWSF